MGLEALPGPDAAGRATAPEAGLSGCRKVRKNLDGTKALLHHYSLRDQLWEVRKAKDAYILINHATGQALDVQRGSKEEGTPVWSYNPNGSQAQLWNLTAA